MDKSTVLAPLDNYFQSVNADSTDRNNKLARVVDCFTPDGLIIDQNGVVYNGHDGIREFYLSASSPVCNIGFKATPDLSSCCCDGAGRIAVEIILSHPNGMIRVGDFFKLRGGKIQELHIFSAQPVVKQ
jgi:hypothetical protein